MKEWRNALTLENAKRIGNAGCDFLRTNPYARELAPAAVLTGCRVLAHATGHQKPRKARKVKAQPPVRKAGRKKKR